MYLLWCCVCSLVGHVSMAVQCCAQLLFRHVPAWGVDCLDVKAVDWAS